MIGQLAPTSRIDELRARSTFALNILRLVALLIAAWCVMTFTHECGHIVCGCACGGKLISADLLPWHLPYSIFEPDPHPLVTLWGGPVLGVVVPLLIAWLFRAQWLWFIAHFCVLANGAYLTTAWLSGDRYLDTPKLLEHGAHPLTIAVYCAITIGCGYVGFRKQCRSVLAKEPKPPVDSVNHTLGEKI